MAKPKGEREEMTAQELHALLDRVQLTLTSFAELVGVDRSTPYKWASGEVAVPAWVAVYLRAMGSLLDLCATLPHAPIPDRLRGLAVDGRDVLLQRNSDRRTGIAFIQQAPTIRGMDGAHPMTPQAFKQALQSLGWNQSLFARRMDLTVGTVSRWANGSPIPGWVPVVLGLLLDLQVLHSRFVQPQGGKANGGP